MPGLQAVYHDVVRCRIERAHRFAMPVVVLPAATGPFAPDCHRTAVLSG
jgi:hypothetical protein